MKSITNILAVFTLIILGDNSFAQNGEVFPEITAENLKNEEVLLPQDHNGQFAVVGVAFSEDAQDDLYTWGPPVHNLFLDKEGLNAMVYDVKVNLLLLFTGVNKAAYNKAEKMVQEGTEETYRDHILLYKGEMGDYRNDLSMKDRKVPYIFVLDKEGKIIYSISGRYTTAKMEKITELVEE